MPIVEITLMEGRTKQQKADLMKAVTEAVVTSVSAPAAAVRVILREIPAEHFAVGGIPKG
ncbi:MAG TPA: 2-hydroxymuconate tautomerase [Patescibacteria group bacterium]|jgi:4-oxalocrotonate tautomerase|nr:2-hydroxymuconate tautomerase [Patescibacteria group bacterium]